MLYNHPQYYEAAFSFRDIPAETSFMGAAIERYSAIPVERVLEIACGPAPHAGEFIRRGYQYLGLDINVVMLQHAESSWSRVSPKPLLFQADMVSFTSPETVDFVFVMLGSLYLNSLEEMQTHFDSVAAALKPGGLYFLDCCIQFSDMMVPVHTSRVVTAGERLSVDSSFDIRLVDPAQQLYEEVWRIEVNDGGENHRFEMIERNKALYPQEFLLFMSQRPDFDFVGWWRDWDFTKPLNAGCHPERPIALVRRV